MKCHFVVLVTIAAYYLFHMYFLSCQFARDFYIGQWLYDSHLELEKLLKDRSSSPTAQLSFRDLADEVGAEESSSNSAVQQCELKKEKILVLLDSHKNRSFLSLAAILSEGTAHLVSRHLASSRALTKSFDLYLNKVRERYVHITITLYSYSF